MRLGDLLHVLRDAYCRTIGIEYMHIQDTEEQRWIQEQVEGVKPSLTADDLRFVLTRLNAAEAFEKFLATKYVGTKRFGLEGAESLIPILDTVLGAAADDELDGGVLGMSHRGRLNVLANIVGKSYDQIFREFEGYVDPTSVQGSGDVKYHLGAVGKYVSRAGADIKVELAAKRMVLPARLNHRIARHRGTINGHATKGVGNQLTSKSGFAEDGLTIAIESTQTGGLGTVTISSGIADKLPASLATYTDSTNGILKTKESTIQESIDT